MSQCSKCKASISFRKTPQGKWMPVDATPNSEGNLAEAGVDDEGISLVKPVDLFTPAEALRFMPHWATCPDADSFRKVAS